MSETSPCFHKLLCAIAGADAFLRELPDHDIPNEHCDLSLRSYSFLCHAAIEEYLESISNYVLSESFKELKQNRRLLEPIASACLYYNVPSSRTIGAGGASLTRNDFWTMCATSAIQQHRQAIFDNNGIKTKDQDALLEPVGCRIFDFDRVLSQSLNSLGTTRGKIAHTFSIKSKLPKAGLQSQTETLKRLLLPLDQFLCAKLTTESPL